MASTSPVFNRQRAFARFYRLYPRLRRLQAPLDALYDCYVLAVKGPLLAPRIPITGPDSLLLGYVDRLDELRGVLP